MAGQREVNRHAGALVDQLQKAPRRLYAGAKECQAMGFGDDQARGEKTNPTRERVSKQAVRLGMVLVASGVAMFIPAGGGREKVVAATVMALSGIRFVITGVAELSGTPAWMTAAGWTGLLLAAVSLYAALAFELEGTDKHEVLPLWRRGAAASAVQQDEEAQLADVAREPGVRAQL